MPWPSHQELENFLECLEDHMVSVTPTRLCPCSMKTAIDNKEMNWHGWIWPMGHSFPTPALRDGWYDYLHCRHEDQGLEGLRESEWSGSLSSGTPRKGKHEFIHLEETCGTPGTLGNVILCTGNQHAPGALQIFLTLWLKKPKTKKQNCY